MSKEIVEKLGSITVKFKATIGSDGAINRVAVFQFGAMIQMTAEQARSLAATINAKIGNREDR